MEEEGGVVEADEAAVGGEGHIKEVPHILPYRGTSQGELVGRGNVQSLTGYSLTEALHAGGILVLVESSVRVSLGGRTPIVSTQTQEGSCTPHWRRLLGALYTVS